MNATQGSLGGFEERLLAELRRVVAAGLVAAGPEPALAGEGATRYPRSWRRRALALAGGLAAVAIAAVAVLSLGGGGDGTAWAVTRNDDGTVTVEINSLRDADGLERKLRAAGIPAVVRYLPEGKACAATQAGPAFPPSPDAKGAGKDEFGLSVARPGASDRALKKAGEPPAGAPPATDLPEPPDPSTQSMRVNEDGSVEFTISRDVPRGTTLVITSQTLTPDTGPAPVTGGASPMVDGSAVSIMYAKGNARPCKVVDAPE
jgi:hypothetical protein